MISKNLCIYCIDIYLTYKLIYLIKIYFLNFLCKHVQIILSPSPLMNNFSWIRKKKKTEKADDLSNVGPLSLVF